MIRAVVVLAFIVIACGAQAQIAVPTVQVPSLPLELPLDINKTVSGTLDTLNPVRLRELRKLRVRELLRTHGEVIEPDPHGAPMVRAELLAFSPSEQALAQARAAGFTVVKQQTLAGLEARMVVLRAPVGMSTRRALQKLRVLDASGTYDFNHIYLESGVVEDSGSVRVPSTAQSSASLETQRGRGMSATSNGRIRGKIGLVDGGIDGGHVVFHESVIRSYGCNGKSVISAHGTAVASLLIGNAGAFRGSAPGTELYAADVYCGVPTGGAVDVISDALAWLAREQVPVINISLVGPPNIMLEAVIRAVMARGHFIVAAVGNDGPSSPPLYPAAYSGVIGVTGVDARNRVLLEAVRGPQVDFSAPGADMAAAQSTRAYTPVRGTSFAAPIVAGLLSSQLQRWGAERALVELSHSAVDLGRHGPDRIYGNGLIGAELRIAPSLLASY